MRAIHQFVAGFTHGDAISNEARVMRGIFRTWGFQSDIFSETRRILPESCATRRAERRLVPRRVQAGRRRPAFRVRRPRRMLK